MDSLLVDGLEEKVKASVQRECARAYAERKHDMTVHYRSFDDDKTARENPPPVYKGREEEWTDLLDRRITTEEFQRRSEANKKNRAQHSYPSLHGSRSYGQNLWREEVRMFVKRCILT